MPDWGAWPPVALVATSLVTGVIILFLGEGHHGIRSVLNMAGATLKLVVVGAIFWGLTDERHHEARLALIPGFDLVLRIDPLSLLFVLLSSGLWFLTTLYAIGYLEASPNRARFFGFFSFCVTATMGIALAGNLITFFIFYELLTITTYPLVVHRGTERSLRAGSTYLLYTLGGGAALLLGVIWLQALVGPVDFTTRGAVRDLAAGHRMELSLIYALLIGGLGVKTALVPLHGWLPLAMVAPAPVSALLHAVAVVKAGAYGIVRVVYDVYGLESAESLGLLTPLAGLAAATIVYGSLRALAQDELKRRLAFSTVSQLSYIVLGTATLGPLGTTGGLVHLIHQGLMKITLFFCAGNLAETLGLHHVRELDGVGRRMPLTMAAFTLAALGMIGVPPTAGFVSKWYLGLGGLAAGQPWVIPVLLASSLLNAMYFLPIVYRAWFAEPAGPWQERLERGRLETPWMLLLPPLATATLALAAGVLAGVPGSPLMLARGIVRDLYASP